MTDERKTAWRLLNGANRLQTPTNGIDVNIVQIYSGLRDQPCET